MVITPTFSAWLMAKTPQPLPVKWLQQYPTPTKHSRVATPPAKGLVDKWERSRKEKCLTIEVQRLPYDPLNIDHVYTEGMQKTNKQTKKNLVEHWSSSFVSLGCLFIIIKLS